MTGGFSSLPTQIAGIDAVAADSAMTFCRHTHDQFGIGLILHGAQQSASGRGPVEAEAGDVITVNPGEVHDGKPLGQGGRAWRMIYIDPEIVWAAGLDLTEGRRRQIELARPVARDIRLADEVGSLFSSVTAAFSQDVRLITEERLFSILMSLTEERLPRTSPDGRLRAALQRLEEDPARAVSLQELADLAGLSRFQVLRAFVKQTGLPPHAYQRQCRLHLARRLIRARTPLTQAALQAGFADQSHMHRLFVRSYGMTPGAYAMAAR
ncbi:AraC family transcriptional regulator [Rhizobium sp. SSA_523]|uniref:AraC family transcriptional regulator n=1 Tax=Rhizobium sp. SSA_523 TaxID=2952477 RepID=UPI00209020BC|nr:AraC family transcriptional regulator [Rhizobium sp. SSA_523]MCO5733056.1 AraC family transcriptional regulator [Rhizobium sp. SSA_523]WKC23936.1 AraC family transcriptional regulator [Rhizobium sp. SSA_523]